MRSVMTSHRDTATRRPRTDTSPCSSCLRRSWKFAVLFATCLPLFLHATGNDWPSRDGDPGGQRYSTLKQITPANVAQLTTAWTFDTGSPALQVTPLVVGGVMYIGVGSTVFALEPETSKVVWKMQFPGAVSRRG